MATVNSCWILKRIFCQVLIFLQKKDQIGYSRFFHFDHDKDIGTCSDQPTSHTYFLPVKKTQSKSHIQCSPNGKKLTASYFFFFVLEMHKYSSPPSKIILSRHSSLFSHTKKYFFHLRLSFLRYTLIATKERETVYLSSELVKMLPYSRIIEQKGIGEGEKLCENLSQGVT